MPKTAETIFNIFIFIPLGIALAVAVRKIIKGNGPVLLYCIIGGAFAATMEPIVDVLGLVYLKEVNAFGTFTVLDRTMPLYICFVYPWYVGGLGYLASRLFRRGVTMKNMFALWALDCVVDIFLETPGILAGTYLYYGHQPFNFWGFPLWWGFVNPVMPMLAGALIYHLEPRLDNAWKKLAIIACIPMADGIANGAAAWPLWAVLNQDDVSYVWTHLAALVVLGLALFSVWIIGLTVARPADQVPDETLGQKLKALIIPTSPAKTTVDA
ncbi:hypothetical protein [Pseudonocardia spinosispora]|uniref:hypothetical protein n=1 Tax=Pseudonocardia spinosispora TaxID=103441 RepID=UPI0012EC3BE0|nr:hypothetical protein [Pseudonocardia spinosispora]